MIVCQLCGHSSAWRTLDKSLHYEERLVDLLNGTGVLTDGSGDCRETYRTATELIDYCNQNLVVDLVEAILVDVQRTESDACDVGSDASATLYLCKVAHSTEQGVCYTRRATRPTSNLGSGVRRARSIPSACLCRNVRAEVP